MHSVKSYGYFIAYNVRSTTPLQCDEKNFSFFFFPKYTLRNLRNQSISLTHMLVVPSAGIVAAVVFVNAPYFIRSATLEILYA